jgi:hypothetical protein
MGTGLVPHYDKKVPPKVEYEGDGKGIANEYENFEALATELAITPLSSYIFFDPTEFEDIENPDEISDEEEEGTKTEIDYFPISEGISTVEALLAAIKSNKDIASRFSEPDYTIEELSELVRSLRAAQALDAKFCLMFF